MNDSNQTVNLTLGELLDLHSKLSLFQLFVPNKNITIQANNDRACIKDDTGKTLAWIKRAAAAVPTS